MKALLGRERMRGMAGGMGVKGLREARDMSQSMGRQMTDFVRKAKDLLKSNKVLSSWRTAAAVAY